MDRKVGIHVRDVYVVTAFREVPSQTKPDATDIIVELLVASTSEEEANRRARIAMESFEALKMKVGVKIMPTKLLDPDFASGNQAISDLESERMLLAWESSLPDLNNEEPT